MSPHAPCCHVRPAANPTTKNAPRNTPKIQVSSICLIRSSAELAAPSPAAAPELQSTNLGSAGPVKSLEGKLGHRRSVNTSPASMPGDSVTTNEPSQVGVYPLDRTVGVTIKSAVNSSLSTEIIRKPRRPVRA